MSEKTMSVELTEEQINLLWNLLYRARDDVIRKYGDGSLSHEMRILMDKLCFHSPNLNKRSK